MNAHPAGAPRIITELQREQIAINRERALQRRREREAAAGGAIIWPPQHVAAPPPQFPVMNGRVVTTSGPFRAPCAPPPSLLADRPPPQPLAPRPAGQQQRLSFAPQPPRCTPAGPARTAARRPTPSSRSPRRCVASDDACSICCDGTMGALLAAGDLGAIDCCAHAFCFGCIEKWATEVTNKCPLCQRRVGELRRYAPCPSWDDFAAGGHRVAERRPVEEKEQKKAEPTEAELEALAAEAEAEYDLCQECNGGHHPELLLLCDGCDSAYHTFCLDPPLDAVPEGDWYCPDCAPTLAPPPRAARAERAAAAERAARAERAAVHRDAASHAAAPIDLDDDDDDDDAEWSHDEEETEVLPRSDRMGAAAARSAAAIDVDDELDTDLDGAFWRNLGGAGARSRRNRRGGGRPSGPFEAAARAGQRNASRGARQVAAARPAARPAAARPAASRPSAAGRPADFQPPRQNANGWRNAVRPGRRAAPAAAVAPAVAAAAELFESVGASGGGGASQPSPYFPAAPAAAAISRGARASGASDDVLDLTSPQAGGAAAAAPRAGGAKRKFVVDDDDDGESDDDFQ